MSDVTIGPYGDPVLDRLLSLPLATMPDRRERTRPEAGSAALCQVLTSMHAAPGPLPDHLRASYTRAVLAALDALPD